MIHLQEQMAYCAVIERFRDFCADRGLTFQEGMRAATAMGEEPTVPTAEDGRCRWRSKRRAASTARMMEVAAFNRDIKPTE